MELVTAHTVDKDCCSYLRLDGQPPQDFPGSWRAGGPCLARACWLWAWAPLHRLPRSVVASCLGPMFQQGTAARPFYDAALKSHSVTFAKLCWFRQSPERHSQIQGEGMGVSLAGALLSAWYRANSESGSDGRDQERQSGTTQIPSLGHSRNTSSMLCQIPPGV